MVLDAPVGPNLAVAVRAGHYGWGCADTTDLKADGTLDVKVTIVDKPIELDATDLDLALTYEPDAADYGALIGDASALLRERVLAQGDRRSRARARRRWARPRRAIRRRCSRRRARRWAGTIVAAAAFRGPRDRACASAARTGSTRACRCKRR